jgi:GINS complex subunit 2
MISRMSKLRKGFRVLEGGAGLQINGVGGMEVAEVRGFVGGVVDGLRYVLFVLLIAGMLVLVVDSFGRLLLTDCFTYRKIGRSREEARREREAEERENGLGSSAYPDEDDDDMQL